MAIGPILRPRGETAKYGLGGTSKRCFDIVFGSLLFAFTIPLVLVAATALKLAGARPVVTRQCRLGLRGRPFAAIELTTAADGARRDGARCTCGRETRRRARIAQIGTILRESGIHKLPRLVNVIRGEMSLVGPRALHPSEACRCGDQLAFYLSARPGLIQARGTMQREQSYRPQTFDRDLEYVRHWNFRTDVVLLARAIFTLNDH